MFDCAIGTEKVAQKILFFRRVPKIKGINKLSKEDPEEANKIADEIIKNTYRTLLTRGQKGCYIYCTDKNLSEYLKKRLNKNNEITYPMDEEEARSNIMVAEDSEDYKYE